MITVLVVNASYLDDMTILILQNILHNISENVFFWFLVIFVHKGVKNAMNCAREGRLRPLKLQEGRLKVIPR